jgi:hypothetical protein
MKLRIAVLVFTLVATAAAPLADTLVLHNGRRIQGELIGVYGREIEFEERNGGSRRALRIPRSDIARIEFEEEGRPFGGTRDRVEAAPPAGTPRGMRERRVNVSAREPWTDTGIDVRPGQEIYFSAEGEVRWGPNRRDGAAGERNSPSNPGRPLPDRPAASLIGRIGEDDVFFIGDDPGPFRIRGRGRLHLGINDDVWQDNTGALRVTVAY